MKRLTTDRVLMLAMVLLLAMMPGASASAMRGRVADEHFSVREYSLFHDVLHPLQHEALPNKDFKTIRAQANELVTRGRAIIRLGIPAGVGDKAAFEKALKTFEKALAKFKTDARKKSDTRLEESYNAVHDTFEMLASMLPRK